MTIEHAVPASLGATLRDLERRLADAELRLARLAPTPWTEPTLENSWIHYNSTSGSWTRVAYRREGDVVRLRGLLRKNSDSGAGESIFTLPSDFRPPKQTMLECASYESGTYARDRLTVTSLGVVQTAFARSIAPVSAQWLYLDHEFSTTETPS